MNDADVQLVVDATLAALDLDRQAAAQRARRVAPILRMKPNMTGRQASAKLWRELSDAGMTDDEILGAGVSYGAIMRIWGLPNLTS